MSDDCQHHRFRTTTDTSALHGLARPQPPVVSPVRLSAARWLVPLFLLAAATALLLLTAGCASTTIHYERTLGDGTKVKASYRSTKNLTGTLNTNGTFSVIASASEATDANTRLIKQVTESFIQVADKAK